MSDKNIIMSKINVNNYYTYLLRRNIEHAKGFHKKKKKEKKEKSKSEKNGLVKSALSYLCYYASINYRISMYENVSLNFDGPIYY